LLNSEVARDIYFHCRLEGGSPKWTSDNTFSDGWFCLVLFFEFDRCSASERLMNPLGIVESVDVLEDAEPCPA